jgi:hypothetical protein
MAEKGTMAYHNTTMTRRPLTPSLHDARHRNDCRIHRDDMASYVKSAMSAHERLVARKLGANWLSQKRPLAYEYCTAMERMWLQ